MTEGHKLEGALLTECAGWIWEQLQEDGMFVAGELIELILETERELGVQADALPDIAGRVEAALREQSHLMLTLDRAAITAVLEWEDEFLGLAGIPRAES